MPNRLTITREFAVSERLLSLCQRQFPVLSRALPALGYLLRCPEGARRAVQLGKYEAPISAQTGEIDVFHVPHATIMQAQPYRDAVLNFLAVIGSTAVGPELLEEAYDKTGNNTLHMDSFLESFRRACYPELPAPSLGKDLNPKSPDLLYQRIIEQAVKQDVSLLTPLFLTDPNFPSAPISGLPSIISSLSRKRISVPAAAVTENLGIISGNAAIVGATMKRGTHVMFHGPIHEKTMKALGFPRPASHVTQENCVWEPFDRVMECRIEGDALLLSLTPDSCPPASPLLRDVRINIGDIHTFELTGLSVFVDTNLHTGSLYADTH
jgi:hypothetical protein